MEYDPEQLVLDPATLRARAERCRRLAATLAAHDAAVLEALAHDYDAEAARLEALAPPAGAAAVPPAVAEAAREAAALAEGVPGIDVAVASTVDDAVASPPTSVPEPPPLSPLPLEVEPDDATAETPPPGTIV